MIAFIREEDCIGCTKCIDVCPTDAIVGASKQAHTVIPSLCIECELCLPPCPMDCIELKEISRHSSDRNHLGHRVKSRKQRIAKQKMVENTPASAQDKRSQIAEALARRHLK